MMDKPLGAYLTPAMALGALGHPPRHNMVVYRITQKHNIPIIHKGRMTLVPRARFLDAAGFNGDQEPLGFPEALAGIPMSTLLSREETAAAMGCTIRHVYNLAKTEKVECVDLSEFGGIKLFRIRKDE